MAYGDLYREQVAKELAEILRKSQIKNREKERELAGSKYNAGLQQAALIVHAFLTEACSPEQAGILKRVETAIIDAKVKA